MSSFRQALKWRRVPDGALFSGYFGANAMRDFEHGRIGLAVIEAVIGFALYIWATWGIEE